MMKSDFSCLPLALRRFLFFLAIVNIQITKVSGANIFDGTGFNSQYDIQPCTEENKGDCNCGTGTIKVCDRLIDIITMFCMAHAKTYHPFITD